MCHLGKALQLPMCVSNSCVCVLPFGEIQFVRHQESRVLDREGMCLAMTGRVLLWQWRLIFPALIESLAHLGKCVHSWPLKWYPRLSVCGPARLGLDCGFGRWRHWVTWDRASDVPRSIGWRLRSKSWRLTVNLTLINSKDFLDKMDVCCPL